MANVGLSSDFRWFSLHTARRLRGLCDSVVLSRIVAEHTWGDDGTTWSLSALQERPRVRGARNGEAFGNGRRVRCLSRTLRRAGTMDQTDGHVPGNRYCRRSSAPTFPATPGQTHRINDLSLQETRSHPHVERADTHSRLLHVSFLDTFAHFQTANVETCT